MNSLYDIKEGEITSAPLLLFDCTLIDGAQHHWCTQGIQVNGTTYESRVSRNNLFEIQTASDQGVDSIPKLTLELANADSVPSEIERSTGFKGATLTCSFVFFAGDDQANQSSPLVLFQGIFNSPESITETVFRITAINRLSAQRVVVPSMRVQRRCAWNFPTTLEERQEAVAGGSKGERSRFYPCGYSADVPSGTGNLNGSVPFTSCSYSRVDCETRGMFAKDSRGQTTARFSGIEFVPSTINVRTSGERTSHLSPVSVNEARYNDFIPLVYGTAWYTPSIVFARNDGNLTRIEVLLGMGEMDSVHKVLVSDYEIPIGRSGQNMTGTGWFNVVTLGGRNGEFNRDFTNSAGVPLGDPYGSLALLSVVVPNRINDGKSLPEIKVLADGLKLHIYNLSGERLPKQFTKNPAWIILDVLLRNGWKDEEIDLGSFANSAAYCEGLIPAQDLNGNNVQIARFECNLVLKNRKSAGDVLRGIRNASRLFLTFGSAGHLQLRNENTLPVQQANKSPFSNAKETLNGGWPAYEFGDGTYGTSGIIRNSDGTSTLRLTCRSASDTPNRYSVEFQDSFNEYQQDSVSFSDPVDIARAGQEINGAPAVLGLPNYNQAVRTLQFLLVKSVQGNLQIEFQTSVKALGITPGDIIALTYLREGFDRQAFRVIKVAPGQNFRTATITAQIHDDAWYSDVILDNLGNGRRLASALLGLPRPLSGIQRDENGVLQFGITESAVVAQDGTAAVLLDVEVSTPPTISGQGPSIPIIALTPEYNPQAAGLAGGQVLYYAISGVDEDGDEGLLSFVVRAAIPSSSNSFGVTLRNTSFSKNTTSFHVYRGVLPSRLNRVASMVPLAAEFTDTGLEILPLLPPDINFHHSTLYWRLKSESEVNATIHTSMSVGNNTLRMLENVYVGFAVRIIRGAGEGQERLVASNSEVELRLKTAWDIAIDETSTFVISQSAFQIGATGQGNRFQFEVPNREGTVVQILGRSANAAGAECPAEISPLTRWKIGGAGLQGADADVPPEPMFSLGLSPGLNGMVELGSVSFANLKNTATIVAGTLTIHIQEELNPAAPITLATAISDSDTLVGISETLNILPGSVLQLNRELLQVEETGENGALTVTRGIFGTGAEAAEAGASILSLLKHTVTVPFIRHFFGTPASGDWRYTVPIENVRVAAAEFYVTNSQGNSPAAGLAFTNNIDKGLRTLAGGQYSFQIAGPLAVEDSPLPEVILETDHVIGDISAFLGEAPTGSGVELRLTLNSAPLCTVEFETASQVASGIRGVDLPVMRRDDRLGLDIVSIGAVIPGFDLTLVIRI